MRRLPRKVSVFAAAAALLLLQGCGSDPTPVTEQGATKFDQFCSIAGLKAPLRETTIVVDSQAIADSKPEDFRQANPALFALVLGLADPERSIETGATAPRERITLLSADSTGGAVNRLFTGCVPGMSKEEESAAIASGGDSAISRYFGSDSESKLQEAREQFRKSLIVALVQLKAGKASSLADSFPDSALVKIVRAIGPGASTGNTARRLFVFTNPAKSISQSFASHEDARVAGLAAGEQTGTDLGQSEAYLILSGPSLRAFEEPFLTAFFLQSRANLRQIGVFSADALKPVPTQVRLYTGDIPLAPDVRSPLDLRLAFTAGGELVNSWISYSASKGVRSTPVEGQMSCSDEDHCTLRGNPNGGLGQLWRTKPGSEPQPLPDGPFGGMRAIEATDTAGHLTGRIYDPVIFVGTAGDLKFDAKRRDPTTGN
jgi:hypothetical protein